MNDRLFDMGQEDPAELELLKYTPSSALGSCRYKMADPDVDDTDYKRILEIFKKYDVRYFFYNGGNDSMDTCNKIRKYMQKVGYECRVMGVPKTIDNDLFGTDHCPGFAALGSCRYKMADPDVDDTDYKRILEIFKKYDVRYFFYNGGNDSMDTCNKISKYMQKVGYECRVMGVPKTIDNDLFGTDHCPGFASAAKYIATSCMEVYQDARV